VEHTSLGRQVLQINEQTEVIKPLGGGNVRSIFTPENILRPVLQQFRIARDFEADEDLRFLLRRGYMGGYAIVIRDAPVDGDRLCPFGEPLREDRIDQLAVLIVEGLQELAIEW